MVKHILICPWCGGPLPTGYHHCQDCHRKQLLSKGLSSDIDEEGREIKDIEEKQKWLSEKDSGGYLSLGEVCIELNRSRRWLWKILRAIRPSVCSGELAELFGHPDGSAIISSRYGTLISKKLISFIRLHTRKEEVHVIGENVYISSRLASEGSVYSRRWINHSVKSGRFPGRYDFGRVWVDKRKFHDYQAGRQYTQDGSVIRPSRQL